MAVSSVVRLYKNIPAIPLAFTSPENRETYFANRPEGEFFEYAPTTHIRISSGIVAVQISYDEALTYNFISIKNKTKTYYGRIADAKYVNEQTTLVFWTLDKHLTYMFDYKIEHAVIERQHLNQEDYAKSLIQPYTTEIPALATAEQLPSGVEFEPEYMLAINRDGDRSDGLYVMAAHEIAAADMNDYLQHRRDLVFVTISRIDWNNMGLDQNYPENVQANPYDIYSELVTNIVNMGGFNINPGDSQFTYNGTTYNYATGGGRGVSVLAVPVSSVRQPITQKLQEFLTYLIGGDVPVAATALSPDDLFGILLGYFAIWGCVSSIVGITTGPDYLVKLLGIIATGEPEGYISPITVSLSNPCEERQYRNAKLARYPYSRIEAISSTGNVSEFLFERFTTNTCSFAVVMVMTDSPAIYLIPEKYDMMVDNSGLGYNYNQNQMCTIESLPLVPYNIDSYLTFISSKMQSFFQGQDVYTQFERGLNIVRDVGKAGANVAMPIIKKDVGGAIVAGASGIMDMLKNYPDYKRADIDIYRQGMMSGRTMEFFAPAAPAFGAAAHKSGDSTPYMIKGMPLLDFKLIRHRLDDAVAATYDDYFDRYGYNFNNAVMIPYIYDFISGGSENMPRWVEGDAWETTYVQTNQIVISGVPEDIAMDIAGLYNGGTLFINGDKLVNPGGGEDGGTEETE